MARSHALPKPVMSVVVACARDLSPCALCITRVAIDPRTSGLKNKLRGSTSSSERDCKVRESHDRA